MAAAKVRNLQQMSICVFTACLLISIDQNAKNIGGSESGSQLYVYIGIGAGSLLLIIVVIIIVVVVCRRRRRSAACELQPASELKTKSVHVDVPPADSEHVYDKICREYEKVPEPVYEDMSKCDVSAPPPPQAQAACDGGAVDLGNPVYGLSEKTVPGGPKW